MPQVEITKEVFEALQERAEPLLDSVDSVLRRLLDLEPLADGAALPPGVSAPVLQLARSPKSPERDARAKSSRAKGRTKRTRAARGSILPEAEYELPILRALTELGGKAPSSEVVDKVGRALNAILQTADREVLSSGDVRWKNRVQFVRLKLINAGDMKKGSPRGVWEISDQGRRRASGAA